MSKSLMQTEKECWVCGTTYGLARHHIYPGIGRRTVSEREGCWCWLCGPHHNLSNEGVHFNPTLDFELKRECEKRWIKANNATVYDFTHLFWKNYLEVNP